MTAANSPTPKIRFPEFNGDWHQKKGGDAFKSRRARGEEGLPLYSVTIDRGMVRRDSLDREFASNATDESNLRAEKDDLVYNMMRMWQGAVGRAPEDCMVSPAYVVLTPNLETSPQFFEHWFKRARSIYLMWAYSYGLTSDRLRLYFQDFARVPMALPDKAEQVKIAKFLHAIDERIGLLTERRDALQQFKRGAVQRIFSHKIRFRPNDKSDYSDWQKRTLSSVLFEHGLLSTGNEQVHSVSVNKGVVDQIEHLGRSYSAKDTNNYKLINPGDIIYTKSPTGRFPFGIIKQCRLRHDVIVSPLYGVFRPETYALGSILDAYFESVENTYNYLNPIVQKGAKNTINITNSGFISGSLYLPVDHDEQSQIAEFLNVIETKICSVSAQLEQMQAFKRGLFQQMFV